MNILTSYGIHLQMDISIKQIGETLVALGRSRPAVLWEVESRTLVFISDLDFPLVPEIRLCFDIGYDGRPICRMHGKLLWKEDSLSNAKLYGVLLDPDEHGQANMAKQITRTVTGGRVRQQQYDPYTDVMAGHESGRIFDVST